MKKVFLNWAFQILHFVGGQQESQGQFVFFFIVILRLPQSCKNPGSVGALLQGNLRKSWISGNFWGENGRLSQFETISAWIFAIFWLLYAKVIFFLVSPYEQSLKIFCISTKKTRLTNYPGELFLNWFPLHNKKKYLTILF